MALDENKKSQLTLFINKFIEKISIATEQLLGTSVNLTIKEFSDSITKTGTINITETSVLISSQLAEGSLGGLYIIMKQNLAISLASQMMGSNEAIDLDNSSQEALSSLLNQSFSSALSHSETVFADGLNIGDFRLTSLDPTKPESLNIDNDEDRISLSINLESKSGINENFLVEFSSKLINLLLDKNINNANEDEEVINLNRSSKISNTDFAEIQDHTNHNEIDEEKNLNLLLDIRMGMIVELGRAEMPLKDILKLTKGSIIELDRLSGEPVDLFVNNKLIARGEVVVIDDNFGLRITQLAGTKNNTASELGLTSVAD
jgi:flagellar motor switch protein FliN